MTQPDLLRRTRDDNGGVHFNSGVNNKAAFLMTDGGTFNGQTVTGLGIAKVARIYYEVADHDADLGERLRRTSATRCSRRART